MNRIVETGKEMSLQSIRYKEGHLEILDQLLLPSASKYVIVKGVEDGWRVINKMQVLSLFILNSKEVLNNKSFID